jgi:hypothetical protein
MEMLFINIAEPSFYPYGLGIAVVIALVIITQLLRKRRKSGSN